MTQPHERIYTSRKTIFLNNFIGGIAWGLGATIGLSIVLALLGFLISKVDIIPFFGDFVANIINYIQNSNRLDVL